MSIHYSFPLAVRRWCALLIVVCLPILVLAQNELDAFGGDNLGGSGIPGLSGLGSMGSGKGSSRGGTWGRDTSKVEKSVPTEYHQWRIDSRLGYVIPQEYNDTLPHGFQNYNATDGLAGGYMILGNLGSPRYAVNFLDRPIPSELIFIDGYDYFHTTPDNLLFTNTKSPVTNLQYHKSGTKINGQDRFRAYFATNVNKQTGLGFKIDYLYGRGYYNNQANSEFGGTVFGYHQGEHYEIHAMGSWEHMKMSENGGITDDTYITDPESFRRRFSSRDIPTTFSSLYNRNDHHTYFLTHKYHVGKYREIEVPDSLKPKMPSDDDLFSDMKINVPTPKDTIDEEDAKERRAAAIDSVRSSIKADSVRYALVLDSLRTEWQEAQVPPREFIPITSFIHTLDVRQLKHSLYNEGTIPSTYFTHGPYYRSSYGDFKDQTDALSVKNTLGVELREGFNKWAKAGIRLFGTHEFRSFSLPDSVGTTDTSSVWNKYRENHVSVGGEIFKRLGHTLHYRAGAEFWVIGPDAGDLDISGDADLNFRLLGDTVHFAAKAYFKNLNAPFYFSHFHSATTWWDNSLSRETRTRIEGSLALDRTWTKLRFGVENISNYTHLAMVMTPVGSADDSSAPIDSYSRDVVVRQKSGSIQVMSASLEQGLHFGFFHWENSVTWQRSSDADVLPLPQLYVYSNPYVKFTIAKVLNVEIGVDGRFFTKYYAPDYEPFVNQFAVQDASQARIKIGGYPILNAYANFAIKRVRGYIQYTRFAGGNGNAFWAPHYPIDPAGLHFGISWNFYD